MRFSVPPQPKLRTYLPRPLPNPTNNRVQIKIPPQIPEPLSASKLTLVPVPVVVRDSAGHAVGNLQKENFQLFDDRKQQQITQFTLEKSEVSGADPAAISAPAIAKHFVIPRTFTALLFDDVHSNFVNLPQLQAAALRFISIALARTERLGIFTTSGKVTVDFTDDRAKLEDAIRHLKPNPLPGTQPTRCPSMTYYEANQIGESSRPTGPFARKSFPEVSACGVKNPMVAEALVTEASEYVLRVGDMQTTLVLKTLSDVVDRLSSLPGQRTIVLASPSFLMSDREHREYSRSWIAPFALTSSSAPWIREEF